MKIVYIIFFWQLFYGVLYAQDFVIRQPNNIYNVINTNEEDVYIFGKVARGTRLSINGQKPLLYKTGGFLFKAGLHYGLNRFECIGTNAKNKRMVKIIQYNYQPKPVLDMPTSLQDISIKTNPNETSMLPVGYPILIKATAPKGTVLTLPNGVRIPLVAGKGTQYELVYKPVEKDIAWLQNRWSVTCTLQQEQMENPIRSSISLLNNNNYTYYKTKGSLPFLKEALIEDRLGSPKLTYLDTGVIVKTVGQIGDDYIVALTNNNYAYIEKGFTNPVDINDTPSPITDWQAYSDDNYDYIAINLAQKLPYTSLQTYNNNELATIALHVFGNVENSIWQNKTLDISFIKEIQYKQVSNEQCNITLTTNSKLHWGHSIYYHNNQLIIRVRHQPNTLSLKGLTIGVDAGHGGSNEGAISITGQKEKNITLAITNKVVQKLRAAGATVITTRTADADVKNADRLTMFLKKMPQLVISIHCNSAGGNPLRVGGSSTYYKYSGFKPLAENIYYEMKPFFKKEFGLKGNFNFILNSATDWPNALVETAFISNPEDEEILSDYSKQHQIAAAIISGIEKWLKMAKTK
jgi:N-acetylmuramoyl-L-alanine amidase